MGPNPIDLIATYTSSGGCASKLPLSELLTVTGFDSPGEFSDAGVLTLPAGYGGVLVHTVDVGSPVVSNVVIAARIAVANAVSDVYSVGGTPVAADILIELPRLDRHRAHLGAELKHHMSEALRSLGVRSIGGHTTVGSEYRIGCSVIGLAQRPRSTSGARPGDAIVLSKPLGTGLIAAALRNGVLELDPEAAWVQAACRANDRASLALSRVGCRTASDVTGFGLLGALVSISSSSMTGMKIDADKVILHDEARLALASATIPPLADDTLATLTTVQMDSSVSWNMRLALASPETSGGLVATISPNLVTRLGEGFTTIGTVTDGRAIEVTESTPTP